MKKKQKDGQDSLKSSRRSRKLDRTASRVEEEAERWTGQPQEFKKKQKVGQDSLKI